MPSLENHQRVKNKFNPTLAIDEVIPTVTLQVAPKSDLIYSSLIFPVVSEMTHSDFAIPAFFSCLKIGRDWLIRASSASPAVRMSRPAGFQDHLPFMGYCSHQLYCCFRLSSKGCVRFMANSMVSSRNLLRENPIHLRKL